MTALLLLIIEILYFLIRLQYHTLTTVSNYSKTLNIFVIYASEVGLKLQKIEDKR